MTRKPLGGLAIIADVTDAIDDAVLDPKILLFYAAPNPVSQATPFRVFWTTTNVGHVRILGPDGFDSGILVSNDGGYYDKTNGISGDATFTLIALDLGGNPIRVNSLQLSSNLRVLTL